MILMNRKEPHMIYITGDCHADFSRFLIEKFPAQKEMTKDDYVIICGDFGGIWTFEKENIQEKYWLDYLNEKNFTTLFVDGNHENFDLLNQYPQEQWHGGQIHRIRSNIVHLMRGEIFDIDHVRCFCFGGAPSHDAQYRVSNVNWWQEELPTMEQMKHAMHNLDKVGWKVDMVLTHEVFESHELATKYTTNMDNYGPEYFDCKLFLDEIEKKLDYKVWLHGHYHTDQVYQSPSNKPCISLFNRVITLEEIEKIKGE
jgi:predicted phosphodiesterase